MSESAKPPLPSRSRGFARDLRQTHTDAETRLWYHLRSGRLQGLKFRRQHPVPPYVLDFYCDSAKLAVELDGSQHVSEIDEPRTRFMQDQGIAVIRFWDNDVLSNTALVLEKILASAQTRTLTPDPSPDGRGEKSRSSTR